MELIDILTAVKDGDMDVEVAAKQIVNKNVDKVNALNDFINGCIYGESVTSADGKIYNTGIDFDGIINYFKTSKDFSSSVPTKEDIIKSAFDTCESAFYNVRDKKEKMVENRVDASIHGYARGTYFEAEMVMCNDGITELTIIFTPKSHFNFIATDKIL